MPVFPGALSPTEMVRAWQAGADMVKVFPRRRVGGASYIRSLRPHCPRSSSYPPGGVSLETAADLIEAGASALGVGADLVDSKALRAGQATVVTERARRLVEIVRAARAER